MMVIAIFLQMTFEDWNPFVTWVLFASSLFVPLCIYFYLGVKFLFKEKYEKKEEGHVSKVIYFLRRNLDIKFKQLGQENGIDSQDRYVFSQDLNIWTSSPQEYEKTNGKEIENDDNRIQVPNTLENISDEERKSDGALSDDFTNNSLDTLFSYNCLGGDHFMEPEKSIEIEQEQLDSVSFQDDLAHTSRVRVEKRGKPLFLSF